MHENGSSVFSDFNAAYRLLKIASNIKITLDSRFIAASVKFVQAVVLLFMAIQSVARFASCHGLHFIGVKLFLIQVLPASTQLV